MSGIIINPYAFAAEAFSTKSLNFDGVDDYVLTSPTYSEMDSLLDFAYSFWFKMDTLVGYQSIWAIDNQPQADSRAMKVQCFWNTGNSRLQVYFDNLSYYCYTDNTAWTPSVDTWYHVLITRAQSRAVNDKIRMYIDGVNRVGSQNTRYHTFATNATSGINIGDYVGLGYSPFPGNIDEFAIYTQDMDAYVSEIYNGGTPDDLDNLASAPAPNVWYRMGENSTFSSPQILMPENTNKDKFSNYSMEFDGVNTAIEIPSLEIDTTNDLTLSCWVKSNGFATWDYLCTHGNTSGVKSALNLKFSGSGSLYSGNLGGSAWAGLGGFSDGNWHHLAMTINYSTGDVKFYKDSIVSSTVLTWGSDETSAILGCIGAAKIDGTASMSGSIDEFAIFEGLQNISDLYNGGQPTDLTEESGLVGYWKMGEEATFNTSWLLPNKAQDVFSRYSMDFDGVGDSVSIASNIDLGTTSSVSLWIKRSDTLIAQPLGHTTAWSAFLLRLQTTQISFGSVPFIFNNATTLSTINQTTNWTHLLFVRTGATCNLYVNGVNYDGAQTNADPATINYFRVIGAPGDGTTWAYNGKIDEVAMWTSDQSGNAAAIYGGGTPPDLTSLSPTAWYRMGEEATFSTNWTVPDQIGSNNGTSANMTIEDLVGEAPTTSGNGISDNMTIEDRTGDAPDSSNNALSYNMVEADIEEEAP